MMWIFFIYWQQYWKCDWTMNIGANRNAHGERTLSTKRPQVNWKTWQLGFQTMERYRYWASFQVTRLFHSATNLSARPITRLKSFSFFLFFILFYYYFFIFLLLLLLFIYLFIYFFFFFFLGGGGGVLSSNAFAIWCCIPISRPPRVIRLKRRSCILG